MKKLVFTLVAPLFLTTPIVYADYACWVNEDDLEECGQVVPPEVTQKGFKIYNDSGILIQEVAPAKSQAERDAEKAEKERKDAEEKRIKQQAAQDKALRDLFATRDDIIDQRDARLGTIDAAMEIIQSQIDSLERNLNEMEGVLKAAETNPNVTEEQLKVTRQNIAAVKHNLENSESTLEAKKQERNNVKQEFAGYLEKYEEMEGRNKQQKVKDEVERKAAEGQDSTAYQQKNNPEIEAY